MVLSSSLYRQGGAIHQKLEAEKLEKDRRVKELEEKSLYPREEAREGAHHAEGGRQGLG
jgi:hypothetical protein